MGEGFGNLLSGAYNIFGAQQPQDAAWPYLNKIPGMLNSTYSPYIQAGMSATNGMGQYADRGNAAGNILQGQYGQMINNPDGLINKLGAGFHQSPGYAFQTSQALSSANKAAAAGGMAGTPAEQQQIAGVTNQLANQDYYNYLDHAQNMYGAGISGLQHTEGMGYGADQSLFNTGANASHDLADGLGSAYMSQANLGYQGAINHNQTMGGAFGSIGNFIGNAFNGMQGNGGSQGQNYGQMPMPFSGQNNGWGQGGGNSGMNMGDLASLAMMMG